MGAQTEDLDAIVDRILGTPKYGQLDRDVVARVATAALAGRTPREATKATKRQLHQAYGAFLVGRPVRAVRRAQAAAAEDPDRLRAVLAEAMRSHASSAERLDHLEAYGDLLRGWCGEPGSVVDVACGLGPLCVPWLPLAPGATYWGCDIDRELVGALGELGALLGVEVTVEVRDLVVGTPPPADLGLVLKTVTTLEQQAPGRPSALLASMACEQVVVSVPTATLGGRRGYAVDPHEQVARVVDGTGLRVADDRALGDEHYFLLERDHHR